MGHGERIKRHRARLADKALKRVEVVVPGSDTDRLKRVAASLRSNDTNAAALRREIDSRTVRQGTETGLSLFPFLGDPLFEDFELELPDRKSDVHTPVDFSDEQDQGAHES
jgi:hypothetical protein